MSTHPSDPARPADDRCPGALRLHEAADGPLARVRVPGGVLAPHQVQALAELARDFGDGAVELTARANVQLRAVRDPAAVSARLAAEGLLPSAAHERVRNILASPLSGRVGGHADVRPWVAALDAGLRADPALAGLPGRFLATVDDGTGDTSGLGGDVGLHALPGGAAALVLAGHDSGARVPAADAVAVLLGAARAFGRVRGAAWRLREVPGGAGQVLAHLGLDRDLVPEDARVPHRPPPAPPVGWLGQDDGLVALGAAVPLGRLDALLAEFLAAAGRPVVLTAHRTLVVADLPEWAAEQVVRVLAPMGLVFDAESPWVRVTACAGRPGCASALADVRADAAAAVARGELPVPGRQHWAGCARACGRPAGAALVQATAQGYTVRPAGS